MLADDVEDECAGGPRAGRVGDAHGQVQDARVRPGARRAFPPASARTRRAGRRPSSGTAGCRRRRRAAPSTAAPRGRPAAPGADAERRGRDLELDEPLVHQRRHRLRRRHPPGGSRRPGTTRDGCASRRSSRRRSPTGRPRPRRGCRRSSSGTDGGPPAASARGCAARPAGGARPRTSLQLGRVHVLGIVVADRHDHRRSERVPERVDERERGGRHGSVVLGAADGLEAPARLRPAAAGRPRSAGSPSRRGRARWRTTPSRRSA